jgi:hypothetical protein
MNASGNPTFHWSLRKIRAMSAELGIVLGTVIFVGTVGTVLLMLGTGEPVDHRMWLVAPVVGLLGWGLVAAILHVARRFTGVRVFEDGLWVREAAWQVAHVRWDDMARGEAGHFNGWAYLFLTANGVRRRINVNLELDDPAAFVAAIEAHAPPGHWIRATVREALAGQ